jgi:hypothetical protein
MILSSMPAELACYLERDENCKVKLVQNNIVHGCTVLVCINSD